MTSPTPIDIHEQARREAILTARRMLERQPIYLDTETTGLDFDAEIVEVAVINAQGEVILNTLIKPGNPIPADAQRVHGITNDMVAEAPRFDVVWHSQLQRVLAGSRLQYDQQICIYSAAYDTRLIRQSLKQYGVEVIGLKSAACVMELYAEFYGEWNDYRGNYKWQRLDTAIAQCGLHVRPGHRALVDCHMARSVLEYMASREIDS